MSALATQLQNDATQPTFSVDRAPMPANIQISVIRRRRRSLWAGSDGV